MEEIFGSSWKTSFAGVITGLLYLALTAFSGGTAAITLPVISQALGPALIGLLAKDHDTTGNGSTATKN
jgi:hypothetical protein